jgi:5-methylcytosine-specific restriction endonuclease McrA
MSAVSQESAWSVREELIEAGARWSRGLGRLVRLAAEFDRSMEWAVDGAPTCAHWMAEALDVEVSTAREWLRIGRALADLTVIDEAFEQGRLSYSKVRALTRVATPENEHELCSLAERVPAGRLVCSLAAWRARRETPAETEARQDEARRFSWHVDVDGMIAGAFRLPPGDAARLTTAVDAVVRRSHPRASADASRWPSIAQQRADALVALVQGGGAGIVTEVVLHVRGDGCTLDDGTPISGTVVERIAPTAFLRALIHDADSRPINASGRHRHPTARQRRVVHERDRGCRDCGSTDLLEFDHVPPFEQTKRTLVEELEECCANCHHRRHRNDEGRA